MLIPAKTFNIVPLCLPRLQVLTWQFLHVENWQVQRPFRPFWRLYWNASPGAVVIYDGKTFEMTRDNVLLIPCDCFFQVRLEAPVDHFYCHFVPDESIVPQGCGVCSLPCPEQLHLLMGSVSQRQTELRLVALLFEILAELAELPLPKNQTVLDERIGRALQYLTGQSPAADNSVIAREVGMSISNFEHLFRREIGVSPQRYSMFQRMDQARILLHTTNDSIEEIALKLGFADRYHFSAVFRKYNNISPGAFRKNSLFRKLE